MLYRDDPRTKQAKGHDEAQCFYDVFPRAHRRSFP
jgi:hypothetical protein